MGSLAEIDAVPRDEKLAVLEEFDRLAGLRNRLREMAGKVGEWAGIPMPIEGENLVIEPSHPLAKILGKEEPPPDPEDVEYKIRNTFYSMKLRSTVLVVEREGRVGKALKPGVHHLDYDLRTMGLAPVWGVEQEANALAKLGEMVRHHAFKTYLLTGMFLETSKRSGVVYLFRRLKPTVAIRVEDDAKKSKILAALCMHPIAYYAGSWAGAMCPTDDVVAHLALMRGDEPMFWRRSNQHPPFLPEAGL